MLGYRIKHAMSKGERASDILPYPILKGNFPIANTSSNLEHDDQTAKHSAPLFVSHFPESYIH